MPKPIRRINIDQPVEDDAPSDSFFIGMIDGKFQKIRNNNEIKEPSPTSMNVYTFNEDGEPSILEPIIKDYNDEQFRGEK